VGRTGAPCVPHVASYRGSAQWCAQVGLFWVYGAGWGRLAWCDRITSIPAASVAAAPAGKLLRMWLLGSRLAGAHGRWCKRGSRRFGSVHRHPSVPCVPAHRIRHVVTQWGHLRMSNCWRVDEKQAGQRHLYARPVGHKNHWGLPGRRGQPHATGSRTGADKGFLIGRKGDDNDVGFTRGRCHPTRPVKGFRCSTRAAKTAPPTGNGQGITGFNGYFCLT